ncbi:MAG: hypothetical protein Q8S09_02635 [Hyphomonas sp.]|nr:hypothetical protein [Hyphomonas sp.]
MTPSHETRYFIAGDEDGAEPLTLEQLHARLGRIWDEAGDAGWIDGIAGLEVYEASVISKAVEIRRSERIECPVCCGGELADDFAEEGEGEECANCDGAGDVHSDATAQSWGSEFDTIIEYEMQPPLPPSVPGGP